MVFIHVSSILNNILGRRWKQIAFYDINSMYPSTFCEKYPTGVGFEWTLTGNVFVRRLMTNRKVSLGSIQWLDYMQNTCDEIRDKNGVRVQIQHGWNSKEKMLGKFFVDGYAKVDEKTIIFEYDGCMYHECTDCDREALFKKDESERNRFLQSLPNTVVIRQSECAWLKKMKTLNYIPKISPLLFHKKVYPEKMMKLLQEGKLYGFMLVDICGTDDAKKFLELNWPPILKKAMIDYDDLPEWMKENADEEDFPKEQIVQSMHAQEILLHTCLLKFYLENGFKVEKIHKFFEYEGSPCFEKVYSTVYEARVQATEEKDDLKATAVKLVSNSMYGAMLVVSNIKFFLN